MRHRSGRSLRIATIAMTHRDMMASQYDTDAVIDAGTDVPLARRRRDGGVARATPRRSFDLNAALEADLAPHGLTLGDYQVLVLPLGGRRPRDAHVRPRRRGCSCRRAASPGGSTASCGRVGRAPAVRPRSPGDARRARPTRAALPRGGRPDHVAQRAPPRHRPPRPRRHRGDGPDLRRHPRRRWPTTGRRRDDRRSRRASAATSPTSASRTTPTTSSCIAADRPGPAAGRVHAQPLRRARASRSAASTSPTAGPRPIVVVSKNANVANGPDGRADAEALVAAVAARLGCAPADVLVASTGVIGRRYPIERILAGVAGDARPARPAPRPTAAATRDHDDRHRRQGRRTPRSAPGRPSSSASPRASG